jgi:hypothetical protein
LARPAPRQRRRARKLRPNFISRPSISGEVTFTIPLKLAADTANGRHKLKIVTNWQTCNDRLCLPPKEMALTLDVGVGAA